MPVYEFDCSECTHGFEKMETISKRNNPLKEPCPRCGYKGNIIRLISGADICDPVSLGLTKVPKGYNEVVKNIQKAHPGNTIELRE